MNRRLTTIVSAAAVGIAMNSAAANATIAGDTFDVETQVIGLSLAGQNLLDITVQNSGQALSAPDPDVALVQANLATSLLLLDLGVLGVEWVDDDTFELVFGLETKIDLGIVTIPVSLNVVPTINWTLSDLDFSPAMKIVNVVQVDQDFDELIGSGISWTDNSIQIATNSLVAAGLAINGGTSLDARVTFDVETAADVETPVPVPASIWMMGATGLAAGVAGYRRRYRA